jgi:hypothetical protein
MKDAGEPNARSIPDLPALATLIGSARLVEAYDGLLLLAGGPPDGRCLLYVTETLARALTGKTRWPRHQPFSNWKALAELVNANASILEQNHPHLKPSPRFRFDRRQGKKVLLNPMYDYIDKHPLWAMLCATHEDSNRRTDYALLQMHILYARWREAWHKAAKQNRTITEILSTAGGVGNMRVAIELGKAGRSVSTDRFRALLEALKPSKGPPLFRDHLMNWSEDLGSEAGSLFHVIFQHVVKERDGRSGGERSKDSKGITKVRRPSYPEFIEYNNDQIGIVIEGNGEDEFSSKSVYQLSIPPPPGPAGDSESRKKEQYEFQSPLEAAKKLGVHPAELGTEVKLQSEVPGTKSRGQARQVARARGRSTEIDRSLMPWSSDRLSLGELQRTILPTLEACLQSSDATVLKSATLVAISIDSGRQMKDVVELGIEQDRKADPFSYRYPDPKSGGCGIWAWDAIGPDYESDFDVPRGMAMERAPVLRYPASDLVTKLIEEYRRAAKFRAVPFDRERDHVGEAVSWMKQQSGWEHVTPARLARLRWQALHEATAGELASTCLILGRRAHQASVEMHYAVLEVAEAREKFDEASEILWGKHAVKSGLLPPADAPVVVGARAVPRISLVQETVGRLQAASKEFFAIAPSKFDAQTHGKLLNGAVLYAVWHQFFCFATRAIRDAYQERSLFADNNQVAILSDKDFDDHHKTRLIWADKRLLRHMNSIEDRLQAIHARLRSHRFPKDSPLFFLDEGNRALRITPKTVADQLGEEFPFEVNAPRKLMRFLVRKAGLSHEEAEVYMGHWWNAREPWSPFSSFDWAGYLVRLSAVVPAILDGLGFTWIPEGR